MEGERKKEKKKDTVFVILKSENFIFIQYDLPLYFDNHFEQCFIQYF